MMDVRCTMRGRTKISSIHCECFPAMQRVSHVIALQPAQLRAYQNALAEARTYQNYDPARIGTRRAHEMVSGMDTVRGINDFFASQPKRVYGRS